MTRRVLLAWEMGEGLGHASRLLRLATRLRDLGWRPIVAARETAALADRYAAADIAVVPTPAHRSQYRGAATFRPATFADMMGVCGYADRDALAAVVGGWDAVLDEHRPDVAIADYSPLLSLAAFGRMPLIAIGDGFVTPPETADGGFPPLGDSAQAVWEPAALLANAQAVQAGRGKARPDSLGAIMRGAGQVVSVAPEIDIYAADRAIPAAGPWTVPAEGPPTPPDRRAFAYLRTDTPAAKMILEAAVEGGLAMEAHLPGAAPAFAARLERAGCRVHDRPPPMEEILERCTLVIHHGGVGTLEAAAFAGRPQLLVPRQLEQRLNAKRALQSLPGTVALSPSARPERMRKSLPGLLADDRLVAAARGTAVRLRRRHGDAWTALLALIAGI
ncbi:MAG: glycosyltransferase [Rhodospirillales bacterium]